MKLTKRIITTAVGITVVAAGLGVVLAVAFSGSAQPETCNVKISDAGSNLYLSLSGKGVTQQECGQVSTTGAAQVLSSIPSSASKLCNGSETGSKGQITITVYTDGTGISDLAGAIYCGQLK